MRQLILAIVAIQWLVGCSKSFSDLKPYNSLPADEAIKSESDLTNAVNGMYASMRNAGLFGRSIPFINDLMADNVLLSTNNSSRYLLQNTYTVNVQDSYSNDMWARGYFTILSANNIINAELPASATVDQFKGEAYAMRALVYWNLVMSFATHYSVNPSAPGVPISLEYDPTIRPARNTVQEVYALVVDDLKKAADMMTVNKNSSYATKWFAKAMLARVYLHMGDYPNAFTTAKDVIDNGGFTLADASSLNSYWSGANPVTNKLETIFEITNDAVNNTGWDALASMYDQSGYGDGIVNPELYALYSETDARKGLIKPGTRGGVSVFFVNKYQNYTNASNKDEVKILRYAEVLLTAAEAAARNNQDVVAQGYLNQLVTRRDPSFAGYSSTGAALINDIILERRKELAFEGDRLGDLNRLKQPVVRTGAGYAPNTQLIAADDLRRMLPIPQAETDANPQIEQNDAYK
jgi:hypothetical protein